MRNVLSAENVVALMLIADQFKVPHLRGKCESVILEDAALPQARRGGAREVHRTPSKFRAVYYLRGAQQYPVPSRGCMYVKFQSVSALLASRVR